MPKSKRVPSGARKRKKKRLNRRFVRYIRWTVGAVMALLLGGTVYFLSHNSKQTVIPNSFDHPLFSKKYVVKGVDVSHHNSFINWDILRQNDVTFVYLKSTEGRSHRDQDYRRNYKLAKDAGMKVGTYHFYTFGMDGKKQAEHFIRTSKVKSGDMIPAIDVEHSAINRPTTRKERLDKIVLELQRLEQALYEHYGKHPVIYTNNDCYKRYIASHFPKNPLWICDLDSEPDVARRKWVIWQFSHHGKIQGVVNEIDLNYYRYSFSDFKKLLMPE